ncbi:hypothetical protein FGO68_gene7481 [Halteria grandinella]|uniref:Uncharacterized protein n=1 Tax=Halteria grandinella TaxID=5974 RepID=A0A8J8T6L3_HALGN|nr:hypothetical protein FGO68_gene7481 [Halteria grandinella]
MKCLREVFLKKDQDQVRQQAMNGIQDMLTMFERLKDDFCIRSNIKEEFWLFTSSRIQHLCSELDTKYEAMKAKFQEHLQTKLITEINKIEKFHDLYNQLQMIVEQNSVINNRSLFQVFVDNLKFPGQMEKYKMMLHSMDSPKTVKA